MKEVTFSNLPEVLAELQQRVAALEGKNSRPATEEPINIQQAGRFLNLSVQAIYNLVNKRRLPHSKVGKRLYFLKTDLLAYVRDNRRYVKTTGGD